MRPTSSVSACPALLLASTPDHPAVTLDNRVRRVVLGMTADLLVKRGEHLRDVHGHQLASAASRPQGARPTRTDGRRTDLTGAALVS
jgi:hypothetical protein